MVGANPHIFNHLTHEPTNLEKWVKSHIFAVSSKKTHGRAQLGPE